VTVVRAVNPLVALHNNLEEKVVILLPVMDTTREKKVKVTVIKDKIAAEILDSYYKDSC
jgi:hypothetical protein